MEFTMLNLKVHIALLQFHTWRTVNRFAYNVCYYKVMKNCTDQDLQLSSWFFNNLNLFTNNLHKKVMCLINLLIFYVIKIIFHIFNIKSLKTRNYTFSNYKTYDRYSTESILYGKYHQPIKIQFNSSLSWTTITQRATLCCQYEFFVIKLINN